RPEGQGPSDRRDRRVDARHGVAAGARRGRRHAGGRRQAGRHFQHGRRGGRQLRLDPGAAAVDMEYGVRFARPDELDALPAIEVAADALFRATPYAALVADYPATALEAFADAQDRWALLVAVRPDDRPVGFAHCKPVGRGTLYVAQLSVHPQHAGHRLAARMIDRAIAFHGPRGVTRLTLTTFRDLPWNMPY